ncbi:hypothetical protein DESUT3_18600 [Desulfuromonas versatilis]|uniref:Uncharacterized protein n=1 Tax=Desulfuromonas versatilis TaxID=2802975 RepID=A0ABM8HW50_9BACT|nr:hypothetical protein [Desulfuromonas versatilis]BCR04791.1 hypothetical protein DESUT3_18600 [Desulfuromonas versatilis]
MEHRAELIDRIAGRTRQRFSSRGGVEQAPSGELNAFIVQEIRIALRSLENPYTGVIRGWQGQGYQLDLCWWEDEENPEAIVFGLAGAILDHEVRKALGLPG